MWTKPAPFILATLALSLAYATARYNLFGNTPWTEWPLFIVNKGLSLAGLILLSVSYLVRRGPGLRRSLGLTGFWMTAVHIAVSLAIFDSRRYAKLYDAGSISISGWLCIAAGTIGLLALIPPAWTSRAALRDRLSPARWRSFQRLGLLALLFTAIHVGLLGVKGWFQPASWPGGLPPITLLSTVVALLPLVRLRRS